MGTRTTSTTTVDVPVYAAWECSSCGEKNFSDGVFSFSASSTTRAFPTKNELERIQNESEAYADELWKKKALNVIKDPIKNYSRFRQSLHIYDSACHKCGNKEKWNKGMGYMTIFALDFIPTIISLICVISAPTSFSAWLFFLIFGAIMAFCVYSEYHFKAILKNVPKNSMPRIGSLNPELCKFAEENNYKILTPQQVLECFDNSTVAIDEIDIVKQEEKDTTPIKHEESNNECSFCRKCGTQLFGDSEFCHKCGCKIID